MQEKVWCNVQSQADREYLIMASKIRSCLQSENGKTLYEWLKGACFMKDAMKPEYIDSMAVTQHIASRRDLFIALEGVIADGGTIDE